MKYMLDTNICIYIIKKKPVNVLDRFKKSPVGSIGISAITLAELQYEIMKSANPPKNQDALDKFLTPLEILDFDYLSTLEYGVIRAGLEREGTPIDPLDTLIAAHAKSADVILVTNNEREFERVPGLKIENWTKKE